MTTPSKAERIRYSDIRNEGLPEQGAFLVEEYESKTPVEVKVKKDREPAHYTETVPCAYVTGTVFVCPLKDIECGDREANWCIKCPRRGLIK